MPVKDFHVMYAFVSIWLTKYEMKHPEPDEMSANKILASNAFPCDRTNLFAFIQGSKGERETDDERCPLQVTPRCALYPLCYAHDGLLGYQNKYHTST